MAEQPDWMAVNTTIYDCGECAQSLLDCVTVYPGKDHEGSFLACPECGWNDAPDDTAYLEVEWVQERYGE